MAVRDIFVTANISVDGSGVPVVLAAGPSSWADHLKVYCIRIYGEDSAVPDADGSFLNLANGPVALTNGIACGVIDADDNIVVDLFGGLGVAKNNSDMVGAGWDYTYIDYAVGDDVVYVELKPSIPITVTRDNRLGLIVNDNLTAFTRAYFSVMAKQF